MTLAILCTYIGFVVGAALGILIGFCIAASCAFALMKEDVDDNQAD